jgi:hypothetical protein
MPSPIFVLVLLEAVTAVSERLASVARDSSHALDRSMAALLLYVSYVALYSVYDICISAQKTLTASTASTRRNFGSHSPIPWPVVPAKTMNVVLSCSTISVDPPIAEAMPEVPLRDPIFFVDLRTVTAHVIVRFCLGACIVDDHQGIQMLCSFR